MPGSSSLRSLSWRPPPWTGNRFHDPRHEFANSDATWAAGRQLSVNRFRCRGGHLLWSIDKVRRLVGFRPAERPRTATERRCDDATDAICKDRM